MNRESPPPVGPDGLVAGNYYDKYFTTNPLYRVIVNKFLQTARELYKLARPVRILEVGCGAGDLADRLLEPAGPGDHRLPRYIGTDISESEINLARTRYPTRNFQVASIYELPFANQSFDLVIACEVLEHLNDPDRGLREVARVCSRHVLISVPWEPVWRILNMLSGRYLRQLGNTPGHIQHFSYRGFYKMVSRHFELLATRRPLPWTMLLGGDSGEGKGESK